MNNKLTNMNMFNLSNKTALVTGASSGLGWRFCEVLAAAGAHVKVFSWGVIKIFYSH